MDRGILANRRAKALQKIEEKSGLDLSRTALPKAPSVEIFQLFQLEKLASVMSEEAQPDVPTLELILALIDEVQGVGPSLLKKIEEKLLESF